jgi:sodium/potassium/calcium exchanger 6
MSAAIAKISNYMRLSESLAGSTLLAFSNGASDVITAIVAADGDSDDLVMGSLFGASIFTCTVCLGIIILSTKNSTVTGLEKIRFPAIFISYLFTIGLLIVLAAQSLGYLYLGLILVGIYIIYLIVTEYQEHQIKNQSIALLSSQLIQLDSKADLLTEDDQLLKRSISQQIEDHKKRPRKYSGSFSKDEWAETLENLPSDSPAYAVLIAKVNCQIHETWSERNIVLKGLYLLEIVLHFFIRLTLPPVDSPLFFRAQQYIYPFTSIFFVLYSKDLLTTDIDIFSKSIPVWAIGLAVAACLTLLIALTSRHSFKPTPRWLFLLITAALGIMWMDFIVGVIVDIIKFVQLWTNASDLFLGMTFLGIGNSVVDLFVDYTLAKKGYQTMAITGIFCGQMFNLLIGFGLSALHRGIKDGGLKFHIFNWNEILHDKSATMVFSIWVSGIVMLLSTWTIIKLKNNTLTKPFGIAFIAGYLVFLAFMTGLEVFW